MSQEICEALGVWGAGSPGTQGRAAGCQGSHGALGAFSSHYGQSHARNLWEPRGKDSENEKLVVRIMAIPKATCFKCLSIVTTGIT